MKKQQRAEHVRQRLAELYPQPDIPLDHCDPYTLLLAVLLSAQCTDKMVNKVTPDLWRLAKTPQAMAKVAEADILTAIRPLGLAPRKAKAIHQLSQILVEQHAGRVPESFEALESLPGVGHKTASVVMCQAFGRPAFPVDTHIHRLAQRWGLSNGKNVLQTELDLKALFPKSSWNLLHLQIIYYGREHCTAHSCDGTKCVLCRELFPNRKSPVLTTKA
jgi:endonuclease III